MQRDSLFSDFLPVWQWIPRKVQHFQILQTASGKCTKYLCSHKKNQNRFEMTEMDNKALKVKKKQKQKQKQKWLENYWKCSSRATDGYE